MNSLRDSVQASIEMAVVLCAFDDRADGTSTPWHVVFEVADLRRLSAQAATVAT